MTACKYRTKHRKIAVIPAIVRRIATVTTLKALALPLFALLLTACAAPAPHNPGTSADWPVPTMQLGDKRGLPQGFEPCRKRGCDNNKLFFNPAQPEPSPNTLHRGW